MSKLRPTKSKTSKLTHKISVYAWFSPIVKLHQSIIQCLIMEIYAKIRFDPVISSSSSTTLMTSSLISTNSSNWHSNSNVDVECTSLLLLWNSLHSKLPTKQVISDYKSFISMFRNWWSHLTTTRLSGLSTFSSSRFATMTDCWVCLQRTINSHSVNRRYLLFSKQLHILHRSRLDIK